MQCMCSWKAGAKLFDVFCHYETGFSEIILSLNEDMEGGGGEATDRQPNVQFYGVNEL